MTSSAHEDQRPRLILLTQFFDPEPVAKGLKFAQRLHELGFDVEVVTGFPNYPGGKVYDGYRLRPITREVHGAITVTRLALYPSHDRSRIGRILNYVSFFFSATLYLMCRRPRADVCYAYHPPLTVAMAAIIARFFRRTPVVLDIQDIWPDTLRATGMIGNERLLRVVGWFCRWTWRRADHISVLSTGFRRLLIERGVQEEKITVIPNWADEEAVATAPISMPNVPGQPDRFRVLFAGNMGPAQALDAVLDAATILATTHQEVEFCFLGSGLDTERLKKRAEENTLDNVHFLPRVPMEEVGNHLAAADCLLVHLRADPLFAITIPSKTQAYMAAGRPIVMAVEGDAAELLKNADGGVVVPPEDPPALAHAIATLAELPPATLERLGANARQFYCEHLSFERGADSFAKLLNEASNRRKIG